MRKRLSIKKPIILYDDTGRSDSYVVKDILFKNRKTILASIAGIHDPQDKKDVMINLADSAVYGEDIDFFIASHPAKWMKPELKGFNKLVPPKLSYLKQTQ